MVVIGSLDHLSERTQAVFDAIIVYRVEHDGCWPTLEEIGALAGCSKTTAKYHVDRLIKAGVIEPVPGSRHNHIIVGALGWQPPVTTNLGELWARVAGEGSAA